MHHKSFSKRTYPSRLSGFWNKVSSKVGSTPVFEVSIYFLPSGVQKFIFCIFEQELRPAQLKLALNFFLNSSDCRFAFSLVSLVNFRIWLHLYYLWLGRIEQFEFPSWYWQVFCPTFFMRIFILVFFTLGEGSNPPLSFRKITPTNFAPTHPDASALRCS